MNIEQLARDAGVDWMVHPGLSREPVYVAIQEEFERFADLVRNAVLEEAAVEFQKFLDLGEEEKAKKRANEALESGDEDQIVRALRHQSNVGLYNTAIHRAISAIRAMKHETTTQSGTSAA
jgi:hypothetical protein